MAGIEWDDREFQDNMRHLGRRSGPLIDSALNDVADTVLVASEREVPHHKGTLQSSGVNQKIKSGEYRVGYHTKYAARLHEHPEYNFQKGRKAKYLEDPIKNNREALMRGFRNALLIGLRAIL